MRFWVAFSVLILGACGPVLPPEPPPTPNPPSPPAEASCGGVCERADTLGCDWAGRTPRGAPCEEMCEGVMAGLIPWDLECRAAAESCPAMDACERRGR